MQADMYPTFDEAMEIYKRVELLIEALQKAELNKDFYSVEFSFSPGRGFKKITVGNMDYIEISYADGTKLQTQKLWDLNKPEGERIEEIMTRYEDADAGCEAGSKEVECQRS